MLPWSKKVKDVGSLIWKLVSSFMARDFYPKQWAPSLPNSRKNHNKTLNTWLKIKLTKGLKLHWFDFQNRLLKTCMLVALNSSLSFSFWETIMFLAMAASSAFLTFLALDSCICMVFLSLFLSFVILFSNQYLLSQEFHLQLRFILIWFSSTRSSKSVYPQKLWTLSVGFSSTLPIYDALL